ncbi:unnamed protein product [Paramecium primaurelia]|uniref:Transmembrane protein n=1 Tax=Paramecium primaurelia TaxID=5886 RepID=A0A8S1PV70_PARPR|nr:unnamed protein product [Paramecium primaurelia]
MKFIKKCLKYQRLQLQYLIGHTQVALEQENKLFWTVCEFIRMFQTIALVLLYKHIIRMLNTNIEFDQPSSSQDKVELLCRITMPTILIQEYLSLEQIIYFQLIFLASLFLMLLINVVALRLEYIHFKQIKFQNKRTFNKVDGNSFQSLNLLNSTYNNNDFTEHFLLKQLMGTDNGSLIELQLLRTSILTNYFTHIMFLPQIYWVAIIFYRIHNQTNYSIGLFILNFTLNSIQLLFLIILETLSLYMQQSYRLKDTNYLRLRITTSFKIGQMLRIIPTLIYFSVLYIVDPLAIYNNLVFEQVLSCFGILNLIFDLQDQSFNIPFVQPYKIYVFHLAFSLAFCLSFLKLIQLNINDIITLSMMISPCMCKMLNQLTDFNFKKIITHTLHPENIPPKQKILKRNSQSMTKSLIVNDDVHQIERQICLQKLEQVSMIRLTNYKYFLQFLRLYELLCINQQHVYQTTDVFNPNKSKFLMQCFILIKTHIELCNNLYCFCRGFWGEKKQTLSLNIQKQDMKIFSDYTCKGLTISIDLIDRYIRYYIKLILNIEIYVTQPNLTYIAQLISFLSKSEESLQAWLQVMEVKLQLQEQKKPFDEITTNLIISYSKYQTLFRAQFYLNDKSIKKTILYGDYRNTELQRSLLIHKLMQCLDVKKSYLIKLGNNKQSYEEVQQLYIESNSYFLKLQNELQEFHDQSQCRTSCLLMMLYYVEVRCDYIQFQKYKNYLRTKDIKFFEYPIIFNAPQNICYLKVNLSRFSKHKCRGEILARSENSFKFFGFESKDDFLRQRVTVHELVPPLISSVHNTIIELFLMSNRPNVIRKERYLIAEKTNQEIVFVEMFIDLCFVITGTEFPVYCFMQEIKPIGVFENIRGHIIVDDYEIIQGISSLAYQSLFLDSPSEICNKEISEFYGDFTENAQRLNQMMDTKTSRYRGMTQSVVSQQGCVQQKDTNSIYNHYKLKLEDQLFIMSEQDKFFIDMTITLTYGIINGKVSKYYVIEFNKVQQIDITENNDSNQTNSLKSSVKQSQYTQRTNTLYDIQDNEKRSSEGSIKLQKYSFPQINEQCITVSQNQMQGLKQEQSDDKINIQKKQERKSKFFNFKGVARKSDSNEQFNNDNNSGSSNHIASATSQKQQLDVQKFLSKGMQYQEFSNSDHEKIIFVIHLINALILGIILVFLLLYQLQFKTQAESIIPTIQILQAFITTDYTDNIQLSLMYNKQKELNQQDQYYQHLQRLLIKDAKNYLIYQKNYFLNQQIQNVFSDTQVKHEYEKDTSAWNAAFYILYNQLDFIQDQNQNQTDQLPTYVNLLLDFPYHKTAYENINKEFSEFVQLSIDNFSNSQKALIIILIVLSIIISFISLIVYHNYFKYMKKITRCSEQVQFDALESEINICATILTNKQKLCLYDYRMDFTANFDFRQHQEGQTHFSSYKVINSSQNNTKRSLNFTDEISIKRALSFLYPLFCLSITLIYLGLTYLDTENVMSGLQKDITIYNQGILFQEQFSLLCISSILQENRDYLIQKKYISESQLQQYYEYISPSIVTTQQLSKIIRLPTGIRSAEVIDSLSINICSIFLDQIDIELCERLDQGLLQNGVLESTQFYIIQYRNNYELNYQDSLDYSTTEDIVSINFIIKGITNYINKSKQNLEQYIEDQIDIKMNWFIFIFTLTIILQIILSILISLNLKLRLKSLKQLIYLLPRDTLYASDSFMKTLNYVQRHQNDLCQ